MGTNYYAIPKVTDEYKEKIINTINEGNLQEAKQLIPDSIHIGKSSAGWQFCFNHNNWEYFNKSLESLELFLMVCEIEDEYGQPITYEDFWKLVNNKKDGLDNKKYYDNWDQYNKDFITGEPCKKPAYIPNDYGQENHFGLFFSTAVEFS